MSRFRNGILASMGNERRYRGRDDTGTPRAIFLQADREFHFTLDAAASPENAHVARFLTAEDDALSSPWLPGERVWINPPYSSPTLARFVEKAWRESLRGSTCVLLVPVRADLAWWHDFALRGEIRFIRGRLRFPGAGDGKGTAPFACCLVIFRPPVSS